METATTGTGTAKSGTTTGNAAVHLRGILAVARMEFHQAMLSRISLILGALFILLVVGGTRAVAQQLAGGAGGINLASLGGPALLLWTLTVIIAIFGPILPIVGSVLSLVEERSTRSIDLLLSRPVTRRGLVLGKLLGRAATVAIIAYVGIFLGLIVVAAEVQASPMDILVLATLVALLYIAWVSIAMLLSAFVRSSTMALLLAFGLWVAFLVWGFVGRALLRPAGLDGLVPLLNPNTLFLGAIDSTLGLSQRLPSTLATATTALTGGLNIADALPALVVFVVLAAALATEVFHRQDETGG